MAQATNLMLTVGLDKSKADADLALLRKQIQQFTREMNAAAKQAIKSGDRSAVDAYSASIAQLRRQEATLTVQQKALTASIKETAAAQGQAIAGVSKLDVAYAKLRGNLSTIATGIRAIKYGVVAELIKEGVDLLTKPIRDTLETFNDLKRAATATGFDTSTIQAFQSVLKSTGAEAESVVKVLYQISQAMSALRLENERAGRSMGGVSLLRGGAADPNKPFREFAPGAPTILRPPRPGVAQGPPEIKSQTDALRALGIESAKYTSSLEDQDRLLTDIGVAIEKFRAAGRTDYLGEITSTLLGKNAREALETFREIGKPGVLAGARKRLGETGELLSPEDKAILERADQALTALGQRQAGIKTRAGMAAMPDTEAAAIEAEKALTRLQAVPQEIGKAITDLGQSAVDATTTAAKSLSDAGTIYSDAIGEVTNKIKKAMENATFQPGELSGGMAVGGYVSGPGSGTSDSILARLSNGEFVVNAASVRRLGVGYLRALNSFADGGLVGMPPIRFAEGGLVGAAAGGGTPVHLHLGSQSFALSGSQPVVSALVSEAHAQRMRSAGTKPSWFGSRAGGR